jgi:peptide/nickel transport system permease protein
VSSRSARAEVPAGTGASSAVPPGAAVDGAAADGTADLLARLRERGAAWRVRLGEPQTVAGLAILAVFAVVAVLAPVIAPYLPTHQVGKVYAAPSAAHWLGLDDGGYDVLSNLIYGARTSLLVGVVASVVAMVIGGGIGILSGYVGGKTDVVLMRVTDYFLVIPDIPLMIVAAAVFGSSLRNVIIIIGVIYWTSAARLIRAQVKSVRQRLYVRRVQALGASNTRVLVTHVVPQVAPLLIANTVLMIANAIFAETYITFLGLGDPSAISWGTMIQNALQGGAIFYNAWWAILPPGLAVTIVVLAATMAGQGIEDSLNPRLKVGHLAVRRFRLRPLQGDLERE